MTIKCDTVQISKIQNQYLVMLKNPVSTLGTFDTLKDAVEKPIASAPTPRVVTALETIRAKAEELNWDEDKLAEAFAA